MENGPTLEREASAGLSSRARLQELTDKILALELDLRKKNEELEHLKEALKLSNSGND